MGSQKQTVEDGWIPLSQAVFDIFWKEILSEGSDQILLDYISSPAPKAVEIDQSARTLKFWFNDGSICEGTPWELLRNEEKLPWNPFSAVLLHKAVAEIWETMNRRFAESVTSSRVSLYGRPNDFRSDFMPSPSDQWSLCKVTYWENGTAVLPDGSIIFSVFADVRPGRVAKAGRKPVYDQDQMNGEVKRAIKAKGFPDPDGDIGWQSMADVERLLASFLIKTMGKDKEPAKSSLQKYARKAMKAADNELPKRQ